MVISSVLYTRCPWFNQKYFYIKSSVLFQYIKLCYYYFYYYYYYYYFRIFISLFIFSFITFILKQVVIANNTLDSVKCLRFTCCVHAIAVFSCVSDAVISAHHVHVDHKTFTVLPSIEISRFVAFISSIIFSTWSQASSRRLVSICPPKTPQMLSGCCCCCFFFF